MKNFHKFATNPYFNSQPLSDLTKIHSFCATSLHKIANILGQISFILRKYVKIAILMSINFHPTNLSGLEKIVIILWNPLTVKLVLR